MIKFEIHEGQLFRMLEEPVPLTTDAKLPCLVRLIQDDSPMGKYNQDMYKSALHTIEMCIRINSQNDINTSIANISGSSLHYAKYEIIGYPVAEGSAEWALHQLMQGIVVRHPNGLNILNGKPIYLNGEYVMVEGGVALSHVKDFLSKAAPDGWQLYEPKPKPLLADAKVGDLCKRMDGKWVQIETLCSLGGMPWICYEIGGLRYINNGEQLNTKDRNLDIIDYHPIAPEGSAEWAWQMLNLLRLPVYHPAEGVLRIPIGLGVKEFVRSYAKIGWQLYKESEPEQPKYKVGDWVEWHEGLGTTYQSQITRISHSAVYSKGICIPLKIITRKLKLSEIVVKIGCLSGTIKDLSYAEDGRFWFIGGKTERCPGGMHCILYLEMLDTPTRKLVESLLEAMQGDE